MKKTGGSIINISSLAARCGTVGASTLYGPLKSAVIKLAVSFAGEYAAYGVRVNSVLPGFTATPAVAANIKPDYLKRNTDDTLLRRVAVPGGDSCPGGISLQQPGFLHNRHQPGGFRGTQYCIESGIFICKKGRGTSMKKLINKPENFVKETMEGIIYAYGDKVKLLDGDERILLTNYPVEKGKVGIVTAGGSGHLPVFLGYVGQGMLDGCAVGNVFASPSAKKMADMIKACDYGSGVLCLYGNYGGDNMNFDMACEMVEMDDVETKTVRVKDDVASSPKETMEKRRGVAGMVYAFKAAGAAAERMMSLEEVAGVAQKALDNIRTMGVACHHVLFLR